MSRRAWLLSVITWDGVLPAVVALSPGLMLMLFAGQNKALFATIVLVPVIAALWRAHHGLAQFHRRGIQPTVGRQILFASAIFLLLIFEVYAGALRGAGAPLVDWFPPAVLYLIYLCLVIPALRPPSFTDG